MFARYVLLKADYREQLDLVEQTRIDVRYLRDWNGNLIAVRESEVERFRAREAAGEFDSLPPGAQLWCREGRLVIVTEGLLENNIGRVARSAKPDDENLLVDFGGWKVNLPLVSLAEV